MDLKYDPQGLIPAVIQDAQTGEVLMVAWMDAQALRMTRESRKAHFWSRTRKQLWLKGATSGNILYVDRILVDCDSDALLLRVTPAGPACHTGSPSCFFQELPGEEDV